MNAKIRRAIIIACRWVAYQAAGEQTPGAHEYQCPASVTVFPASEPDCSARRRRSA